MASGVDFNFSDDTDATKGNVVTEGGIGGNSDVNSSGQRTASGGHKPEDFTGPVEKRRRGRQPYPRDENGNIIRPDGSIGAAPKSQKQPRLDVNEFTKNDRASIASQIQGIHAAVATLTRQPVFLLKDQEGKQLSSALCDVLDYHKINLSEVGGAGALYLALGLTVFGIYKPRMDYIRTGGQQTVEATASEPTSKGEASMRQTGKMDFTADVDPATTGETLMN